MVVFDGELHSLKKIYLSTNYGEHVAMTDAAVKLLIQKGVFTDEDSKPNSVQNGRTIETSSMSPGRG